MMAMDTHMLAKRVAPYMVKYGFLKKLPETEVEWSSLSTVIELEKGRATTLRDFPEALGFVFAETLEYEPGLLVWKKSTAEDARKKLELLHAYLSEKNDWKREVLETETLEWISAQGCGVGDVLWPMRTALSGQKNSPGPFEIAVVIGKEKTLQRITDAIARLS